jgi:hypothetical protein
VPTVTDNYSFPLTIDYVTLAADGSAWNTTFDHSYTRTVLPAPFILGSTTTEHQVADGSFVTSSSGNRGTGTNNNTISYVDTKGGSYYRSVGAVLNNITHNTESGSLATGGFWGFPWFTTSKTAPHVFAQPRLPGRARRG